MPLEFTGSEILAGLQAAGLTGPELLAAFQKIEEAAADRPGRSPGAVRQARYRARRRAAELVNKLARISTTPRLTHYDPDGVPKEPAASPWATAGFRRSATDNETQSVTRDVTRDAVAPPAVSDQAHEFDEETGPTSSAGGGQSVTRRNVKAIARKALLVAPGLSSAVMKVAGELIERCNLETGACFPSSARLAKRTGLSERSVNRAIAHGAAAGFFTIGHLGNGTKRRRHFTLHWTIFCDIVQAYEAKDGKKLKTLLSRYRDAGVRIYQIGKPKKIQGVAPAGNRTRRAEPELLLPLPGRLVDPRALADLEELGKRPTATSAIVSPTLEAALTGGQRR